jgi:hypothetical protein
VVVPDQTDAGGPVPQADRAARLAAATRADMAEHLAWVPFVDAVVVTSGISTAASPLDPAATVVPLDLLCEVLTEGPAVIERPTLGTLVALLGDGRLSSWVAGVIPSAAKIDLCQPTPDTTSTG